MEKRKVIWRIWQVIAVGFVIAAVVSSGVLWVELAAYIVAGLIGLTVIVTIVEMIHAALND